MAAHFVLNDQFDSPDCRLREQPIEWEGLGTDFPRDFLAEMLHVYQKGEKAAFIGIFTTTPGGKTNSFLNCTVMLTVTKLTAQGS